MDLSTIPFWVFIAVGSGLALFFEGMPYFLAPDRLRSWFRLAAELPSRVLRSIGLGAMLLGLGIILLAKLWLSRG